MHLGLTAEHDLDPRDDESAQQALRKRPRRIILGEARGEEG